MALNSNENGIRTESGRRMGGVDNAGNRAGSAALPETSEVQDAHGFAPPIRLRIWITLYYITRQGALSATGSGNLIAGAPGLIPSFEGSRRNKIPDRLEKRTEAVRSQEAVAGVLLNRKSEGRRQSALG